MLRVNRLALDLQNMKMGTLGGSAVDQSSKQKKIKWERPMEGYIKIDIDGAWNEKTNEAGIGYVIRDSKGKALMAVAAFHKCYTALYSKLIAIKSALCYVHASLEFQNKKIIIEAADEETINIITGAIEHPALGIMNILEEISYIGKRRRITFARVCRKGNKPANWLAKLAKDNKTSSMWKKDLPPGLASLMDKDLS